MNKSPDAFRTISEVAEDLDLPQHVLRFWETRFKEIKPLKRGGGRRYYRPDDVDLLRGIKHLLYDEGYTIRGLQRILKEQGLRFVVSVGRGEIAADAPPVLEPGGREFDAPDFASEGADDPGPYPEYVDDEEEAPAAPALPEAPPPQRARTVSEIAETARPKGILDRLRGRDQAPAEPRMPAGGAIGAEDRRKLQATLYELLECKRLLDQVRGN